MTVTSGREHVPFLDLVTPHRELEEELVSVFRSAVRAAAFIGGSMVEGFERAFAAFSEADHCVGVASGTDALRFALMAAGVRPGDTVVTVPNTFIATTEAISQAGARPDFVDVDDRTYTLDPEKLREYFDRRCVREPRTGRLVNPQTGSPVTAIVPVHLYGQMADMDAILELAAAHDLVVVEDACQAHGAQYFSRRDGRWRTAGSMGVAGAFSFYPGKNLGACGEAGAITTNDENVARHCRLLRDHGQSRKYVHAIEGYNGRLDAIQAGILEVKLRHLPTWTTQRRAAARHYDDLFASAPSSAGVPYVPDWSRPVYHLYVVRLAERDAIQKHLTDRGIGTGLHYPVPLHLSAAYETLGVRQGELPIAERAAAELLSVPMYPGLSRENQTRVVREIVDWIADRIVDAPPREDSAASLPF